MPGLSLEVRRLECGSSSVKPCATTCYRVATTNRSWSSLASLLSAVSPTAERSLTDLIAFELHTQRLFVYVITPAEEVMYSSSFICLSVREEYYSKVVDYCHEILLRVGKSNQLLDVGDDL